MKPKFLPVALSFALVAASATTNPSRAQEHPNLAKGLSNPTAYEYGNIETISMYNGHVNLAMGLLDAYSVSPTISYRFALLSQFLPFTFTVQQNGVLAELDRRSNVGLGWRLATFSAELLPPQSPNNSINAWVLHDGDGTQRVFQERLLGPFDTVHANVFYSADGSYLRLKTNLILIPVPGAYERCWGSKCCGGLGILEISYWRTGFSSLSSH